MLCKYYLQLGSFTIDTASPDCMDVSGMIKNLDSIKVSYARVDLGGVVRKCGSSLEFTGKAYEAIRAHYEENYLQSKGAFAVYIADNNWNYSKVWECPLDFATLQYDANVVTIGCVDNSTAAVIKANKKSKYEFNVSSLKDSANLLYNGVITRHSFSFGVYGSTPSGETTTDMVSSVAGWISTDGSYSLYIPQIDTDSTGFSSQYVTLTNQNEGHYESIVASSRYNESELAHEATVLVDRKAGFIYCNSQCVVHVNMNMSFTISSDLAQLLQHCTFNFLLVSGRTIVWRKSAVVGTNNIAIDVDCPLQAGEYVGFVISLYCNDPRWIWDNYEHSDIPVNMGLRWGRNSHTAYVNESQYDSSPIEINAVRPLSLLQKLIDKMFAMRNDIYVAGKIEDGETLLSKTLLVAAESIRKISTNKIYSSFTDFCEFMEAVFGYVYTTEYVGYYMDIELDLIDKGEIDRISHIRASCLTSESIVPIDETYYKMLPIKDIRVTDKIDLTSEYDIGSAPLPDIYYIEGENAFAVYDRETDKYYAHFVGRNLVRPYTHFNEVDGHAREMVGVRIVDDITSQGYQFGIVHNGKILFCDARHFSGWLDSKENNSYVVNLIFKHRKDIFKSETIKRLLNVNNLSFQFDDSKVFSDVEVGYPKEDYDNENSGINEFNFTNYYKTDSDLTEQTLSLICPYRADCYGIEELLDKSNNSESTDSDDDIFIVIASASYPEEGRWQIDRSITVQNAYSETVFNAAIAPNKIIMNNEEYIGSCASILKFTSSDANSSAVIGGTPMSANINITKQLFKAGKISIDTDDHCFPETWDGLIEFEYAGKTYKGYLDSIDICFANMGTITYNIIEKCIE